MVKAALKLDVSDRAVLNALHEKGVYFYTLREKLPLSDEDLEARCDFGNEYKNWKPASWCALPPLLTQDRTLARVEAAFRHDAPGG